MSDQPEIDLLLDLQAEDETGLPYTFVNRARHPERIIEGAWVVAGSPSVNAVARVIDIEDGIVHVDPLPGPASKWMHLINQRRQSA